jgi:hypothetical protein
VAQTAGASAVGSVPVVGQPQYGPPGPQGWGTAGENVIVVGSNGMKPPTDTIGYNTFDSGTTGTGIYQSTNSGAVDWWHLVHVPTGALITRMIVEVCDTSATTALLFGMARFEVGGQFVNVINQTSSGATPGCAFFTSMPAAPLAVNNDTQLYYFWTAWSGAATSAVRFQSARIYYRLQVSPAPATATFTDVPVGNPFHRFVEALVASGISGGCGGGNFCPDAPVTRAQMAVFLSVALGLYFPN